MTEKDFNKNIGKQDQHVYDFQNQLSLYHEKNQGLMDKIETYQNKELDSLLEKASRRIVFGEWNTFLQTVIEDIEGQGTEKTIQKLKKGLTENWEKNSKKLEALKSIIPENYYIANNKLANEITKDFTNQGEIELAVIKQKKKGEVITYNSLTYEGEHIKITGRREFTAYDRTVHNAVCTLYEAGNEEITPAMVYRTMTGMTEAEKVSPQAIKAIEESIDKSRFTRLRVNFENEARARIFDVEKAEIDSYLLAAEFVTVIAGGQKIDGYKVLRKPVLYAYAQLTKQIISVPLEILDTREATRNTEEIISIKEYLIRRIEIMKYGKNMSNRIKYDAIFLEVGIENPVKQKSERLRNSIKSLLKLWKKKKYIKNFIEYKEGRSLKGIEITY